MDHARDAEHLDEERLLQLCPWCRYELRGLPIEHRCPECGGEFDRRWQVFGGKSISSKSLRAARPVTFMLIGVLCWFLLVTGAYIFSGQWEGLSCMIPMSIAASLAVATFYFRPSHLIVLAPDGVRVFEGRRQVASYRWELIGRAYFHTTRRAIALPVQGSTVYFRSSKYFRWLVWEADRCVRAINSYPRDMTVD